jgi:membrane protease YdiL (CAAX protease family)
MFYITGDIRRAGPMAVFYLTNSMLMLLLVPVGIHYATAQAAPSFSLFAGKAPGPGTMLQFILLLLLPVLSTLGLFSLVQWKPDPALLTALSPAEHSRRANLFLMAYLLISAAITEEILFRHYLVPRVAGLFHNRAIAFPAAVLISAAVFALGHSAMVSPAWIKYLQTLILGIALGICRVRLGSDYGILLHLCFNAAAAIIGESSSIG